VRPHRFWFGVRVLSDLDCTLNRQLRVASYFREEKIVVSVNDSDEFHLRYVLTAFLLLMK
jgi:hypothetical protein